MSSYRLNFRQHTLIICFSNCCLRIRQQPSLIEYEMMKSSAKFYEITINQYVLSTKYFIIVYKRIQRINSPSVLLLTRITGADDEFSFRQFFSCHVPVFRIPRMLFTGGSAADLSVEEKALLFFRQLRIPARFLQAVTFYRCRH